jgi:hypothetical protein
VGSALCVDVNWVRNIVYGVYFQRETELGARRGRPISEHGSWSMTPEHDIVVLTYYKMMRLRETDICCRRRKMK